MPYYEIKVLGRGRKVGEGIPVRKIVMFGETEKAVRERVPSRPDVRRNHPEVVQEISEISEEEYLVKLCKRCKENKKYFEVIAKGGHVGRDKYYECHFPVCAPNKEIASLYSKNLPRIKKDHKDAILEIIEVTKEEFLSICQKFDINPYFHCNSKHEQNENFKEIRKNLQEETEVSRIRKEEKKAQSAKQKAKIAKQTKGSLAGIRDPYKYKKMNPKEKIEDYIY